MSDPMASNGHVVVMFVGHRVNKHFPKLNITSFNALTIQIFINFLHQKSLKNVP